MNVLFCAHGLLKSILESVEMYIFSVKIQLVPPGVNH